MGKNTFQLIHKGKVVGETSIFVQLPDREIIDQNKDANIVTYNEDGTALMQVKHKLLTVGESIAQVKYNTSAQVTAYGTIKVVQFKQEISSRGEDVYYFSNDTGTFEGTLESAKKAFPDVDFSGINPPDVVDRSNPEFQNLPVITKDEVVKWENNNRYDAEENGGKPTTWEKWADATQSALDVVGLIPGIGEFADLANGVISLARGNYSDAAFSFAAMIPGLGIIATGLKQGKKLKKGADKVEGVYDLVVKNGDDVKGYVGQSKDMFKRFKQHFFGKKGTLKDHVMEAPPIIHQMKGSLKFEREIYEQYIILRKYRGQINPAKNSLAKLLNKVNPVGGRYKIKNGIAPPEFYKKAEEIMKKYDLPKTFD